MTKASRRNRAPSGASLVGEGQEQLARLCGVYVIAGAIAFAVIYALLAWLRYRNYYGGRFDLGNMVQAVYNTAHGHFLQATTEDVVPRQMSRLGSHVDPILAVFALPWLVWPSPVMLLVLQAIIVATAAWPMYRLGLRILKDPRAAAMLAGALLLYPALGYSVLNEFHPVTLATPLLLFGFLYLEERRWLRASVFLVLAALCKEEIPLVIALMGGYFALRQRSWRPLLVTAAAAAYFVFAVWVVIPHFNHGQSAFVNRYANYGSSAGQIAHTVLRHPGSTARDLASKSDVRYWWSLLWPLGGAPLLSPLTTLVAAPEYVLNGLSKQAPQRSIEWHYTAAETAMLFAAAALGLARLQRWFSRAGATGGGRAGRRRAKAGTGKTRRASMRAPVEVLALIVLATSVAGNYVLGPLPFSLPGARYGSTAYAKKPHSAVIDQAIRLIPRDAVISVNNNIGSHLSARRVVYVFPYIGRTRYVIVDERLAFFYDVVNVKMHRLALGALVLNPDYQSVFARDGVYVFKRVR